MEYFGNCSVPAWIDVLSLPLVFAACSSDYRQYVSRLQAGVWSSEAESMLGLLVVSWCGSYGGTCVEGVSVRLLEAVL